MAPTFKARVKAVDWEDLSKKLVTVQALKAMGDDLNDGIERRIRTGKGSDGQALPPSHVKHEKKRARWEGPGPKHDGTRKSTLPISIIQQMRIYGGHREKPAAGVEWKGYDHIIRYGKDVKRYPEHAHHEPGDIYAYQWDRPETFRRANYGPRRGIRTGKMLRDLTVKVKQTSKGFTLTVGPKGKNVNRVPLFKLLTQVKERSKAEEQGQKQKKLPSSIRMALLQAVGRKGTIAADPAQRIGVLLPTEKELSTILEKRFAKPFLEELRKAPLKEVI